MPWGRAEGATVGRCRPSLALCCAVAFADSGPIPLDSSLPKNIYAAGRAGRSPAEESGDVRQFPGSGGSCAAVAVVVV
eukprot:15391609-Heterocapsa_arctica.AAC.1